MALSLFGEGPVEEKHRTYDQKLHKSCLKKH
jgi:hypothetical protein